MLFWASQLVLHVCCPPYSVGTLQDIHVYRHHLLCCSEPLSWYYMYVVSLTQLLHCKTYMYIDIIYCVVLSLSVGITCTESSLTQTCRPYSSQQCQSVSVSQRWRTTDERLCVQRGSGGGLLQREVGRHLSGRLGHGGRHRCLQPTWFPRRQWVNN